MKKLLFGLLILSSLLVLSGCRSDRQSHGSSVTEQSSSAVETEQSSPETDAVITTEAPTDPREFYRRDKTVSYLNCFQKIASDLDCETEIVSMGGGKAALLFNCAEDDRLSRRLVVVDLIKDKVVADRDFDSYIVMYGSTDKGLVVYVPEKNHFEFYSDELEIIDSFEFEDHYGSFSSDGENYYFVVSQKLYRANTKSGDIARINTSEEIAFQPYSYGISADNRYIALNAVYCDDDNVSPLVVVDLESGELEMLSFDAVEPCFGKHGAFFRNADYESTKTYIDYVNESGGSSRLSYSLNNVYYSVLRNSDFVYDNDALYDEVNAALILGRSDNNGSFEFGKAALNGTVSDIAYMREEELILSLVSRDDILRLAVIDPELIEFDEVRECDDAPSPMYFDSELFDELKAAEVQIQEIRDELKPLREKADELERKFGVEIYMSNECHDLWYSIEYNCTDDDYEPENEYNLIEESLSALNNSLEKYPNGYFRQFKNVVGEGGVCIGLVSHINDDFSAAYSCYDSGIYYIIMDVIYDIDMNFGHEMWHNTENYINNHRPDLLRNEDWEKFNPEGFSYAGSVADYDEADVQYTYLDEYDDPEKCDWYFIDSYGKVNECEDKARIMEIAMASEIFDTADYFRSPHIMKKFNVMCDAIRETFDTTGWQDVSWEKYK